MVARRAAQPKGRAELWAGGVQLILPLPFPDTPRADLVSSNWGPFRQKGKSVASRAIIPWFGSLLINCVTVEKVFVIWCVELIRSASSSV